MLTRLLGLETEYVLRFAPDGGEHPGNGLLYAAIKHAVQATVATRPGERLEGIDWDQIFVENGGALYYEFSPAAPQGGLLEASTPECRGPSQLLLYQKAQEALLLRALPAAERWLAERGHPGQLGLLKNARDVQGNVYGPQENYQAEIARGPALWALRAGLGLLLPLAALSVAALWLAAGAAVPYLLGGWRLERALLRLWARCARRLGLPRRAAEVPPGQAGRWWARAKLLISWPVEAALSRLLAALAFRRPRTQLSAFLISRPVVTGTGTLEPDGRLLLSEKGAAMERLIRGGAGQQQRAIFDTANLCKRLAPMFEARLGPYLGLFRRRQRLQLGLSDPNLCQVAEYLKVGTTALMLDLVEEGQLEDAPRLAEPISALHTLIADPTLRARVELSDGRALSALQLQRWYLERARRALADTSTPSLEALEVVRLWAEALDALEADPATLVGRLDWVSKRFLIEGAARGAPWEAQKKIDLKYHELGRGYLASLEAGGLALRLVSEEEIARAIREPPEGSPARVRGRLIRELAGSAAPVLVSWESVRVGGREGGKVIRLDRRRT